jgi:tetratricopeptide (TPR) repeat protein
MDEALADITRAVEAQPSSVWPRRQRADTLYDMGRFEEALADWDEAVRLNPESAWLYAGRGWALLALVRNVEALAAFNKAVELSPDQLGNRANAYLKLGRVEDAIADMDKALRTSAPPSLLAERAYFLTYTAGQCGRAGADLQRSEAEIPENARDAGMLSTQAAVHLWGFYYACPNLYDGPRALELAKRAVLLEPQVKYIRAMLGVALYRAGRYHEARDTLLETLPARGDDPSKLFFLAMTSEKLGKRADARRYFDRAVVWVGAHSPSDLESARFRDEVARVLRLAEE